MYRTARIWDVRTGKPLGEGLSHVNEVTTAEFSPNGQLAATASLDCTVVVWDLITRQPLMEPLRHSGFARDVAFNPDGSRLLTLGDPVAVGIWDIRTGSALPLRFSLETGVNFIPWV